MKTDARSGSFKINRGVKQGDPISPIIFNAVVEMFMAKLKEKWLKRKYGVRIGEYTGEDFFTNLW